MIWILILTGTWTIARGQQGVPAVGSEYNDKSPDGSYRFGFQTGDTGGHYQAAIASKDNTVQGRFGSRDPAKGQIVETQYTSGKRGYRPRGPNVARKYDLSQNKIPYNPPVNPNSPNYNPTLDGYHDPNEDPSYQFNFKTPTYTKNEAADSKGHVNGLYSFVDDAGERHDVSYEAGSKIGFNVKTPFPDSKVFTGTFYRGPPSKAGSKTSRGKSSIQQRTDGSYRFVAAGPDQRRTEVSDASGNRRGSYSYIDDKGQQRTVEYIAGPNIGYRIISKGLGVKFPTAAPFIPPRYPDFPSGFDPNFPTELPPFPLDVDNGAGPGGSSTPGAGSGSGSTSSPNGDTDGDNFDGLFGGGGTAGSGSDTGSGNNNNNFGVFGTGSGSGSGSQGNKPGSGFGGSGNQGNFGSGTTTPGGFGSPNSGSGTQGGFGPGFGSGSQGGNTPGGQGGFGGNQGGFGSSPGNSNQGGFGSGFGSGPGGFGSTDSGFGVSSVSGQSGGIGGSSSSSGGFGNGNDLGGGFGSTSERPGSTSSSSFFDGFPSSPGSTTNRPSTGFPSRPTTQGFGNPQTSTSDPFNGYPDGRPPFGSPTLTSSRPGYVPPTSRPFGSDTLGSAFPEDDPSRPQRPLRPSLEDDFLQNSFKDLPKKYFNHPTYFKPKPRPGQRNDFPERDDSTFLSSDKRFYSFPTGIAVRAHVQSLDILPFGSRIPPPGFALEHSITHRTGR